MVVERGFSVISPLFLPRDGGLVESRATTHRAMSCPGWTAATTFRTTASLAWFGSRASWSCISSGYLPSGAVAASR